MLSLHITVIAVTLLQTPASRPFDVTADRDALAVYAAVLQAHEATPEEPLLLQAETEAPRGCTGFLDRLSGEWAEAARDFRRANAGVRLLRTGLPLGVAYSVIPSAKSAADDARLAAVSPGFSNAPRPGSIKYLALSAIGFNAARTKALVWVRFRTTTVAEALLMEELKDGRWVAAPGSCVGVA